MGKTLFVLIMALLIGSIVLYALKQPKPQTAPAIPVYQTGGTATASDGSTSFTLTDIDCSQKTLENSKGKTSTPGSFCQVFLTVKNDNTNTLLLNTIDQFAYLDTGAKISVNVEAQYYLPNNDWHKQIMSGETVSGAFVFNVPSGSHLSKLELHQTPDTSGATIGIHQPL